MSESTLGALLPHAMTACTAHKASTGEPCKAHAIVGGTVCPAHGGRAPQTRAKADQRRAEANLTLLDMLEPGLIAARTLLDSSETPPAVRARLVEWIADRTLGKVTDRLKVSGDGEEPLEIVITRPAS